MLLVPLLFWYDKWQRKIYHGWYDRGSQIVAMIRTNGVYNQLVFTVTKIISICFLEVYMLGPELQEKT